MFERMGGSVETMDAPLPDLPDVVVPHLPPDHWLYDDGENVPPMSLCMTSEDRISLVIRRPDSVFPCVMVREDFERKLREAARYAIRETTYTYPGGYLVIRDPDTLIDELAIGLLGPSERTEVPPA